MVLTSAFYHRRHKFLDAIIGLVIGSLAMTALMIPMNYIFTVHVFGTPFEIVNASMWVGIVPFNLLKAGINSLGAAVLFKALSPFIRKHREMVNPV